MPVDDPTDPRLTDYRDLTTADRRPDRPGGRGLVIAEGVVVVRRADRVGVRSVLLGVPRRLDELASDLAGLDVPAYSAPSPTMARAVGFHLNRGVLAVADRAAPINPIALARGAQLLAVTEVSTTTRTSARSSATPRRCVSTGCCSGRAARTRSTGAACGCRWGTCCVPFAELPGQWPESLDALRAVGLRVSR